MSDAYNDSVKELLRDAARDLAQQTESAKRRMNVSDTPRTDAAYAASTRAGIYELFKEAQDIERELREVTAENTRLRAALANSNGACVYCSLSKEDWAKCKSGFPGCARSDDAMGCPELGASLEAKEWKEYAQRLEMAGNAMEEFHSFSTVGAWRKAKESKRK